MNTAKKYYGKYRDKKKAQGLRLMQTWTFDKKHPDFAEKCRKEVAMINSDVTHEKKIMDELLSIYGDMQDE